MAFDRVLDDELCNRLHSIEDELIDATEGDQSTLKSFVERLVDLQRIATRAISQKSITTRTITLLRSVASTGAALAKFTSGVERIGSDVERKRQAQLEVAMKGLSLNDNAPDLKREHHRTPKKVLRRCCNQTSPVSPPLDFPSQTPESIINSTATALPLHVSLGHEWLLKHLYDPYPSRTVKLHLAEQTGVSEKSINDWFVHVRRRIGWSKISKTYFGGSRAHTVDCARVVLLGESSRVTVSKQVSDAFIAMKETSEKLYDGQLKTSAVARQLDALAENAPHGYSDFQPLRALQKDDSTSAPNTSGTKRRLSLSSDDTTTVDSETDDRILKRKRSDDYVSNGTSCPPGIDYLIHQGTPPLSLSPPTYEPFNTHDTSPPVAVAPVTRKRRLSDSSADSFRAPKRLCEQATIAQVQSELDPSSLMTGSFPTVDFTRPALDWLGFNFHIPTGVILGDQLNGEIDLSNFDFSGTEFGSDAAVLLSRFPSNVPDQNNLEIDASATKSWESPATENIVFDSDQVNMAAPIECSRSLLHEVDARAVQGPVVPTVLDDFPVMPELSFDFNDSPFVLNESYHTHPEGLLSAIASTQTSLHTPPFNSGSLFAAVSNDTLLPSPASTASSLKPQSDSAVWPQLPDMDSPQCLVQDALQIDKIAKMERLRLLREERQRLEDEELRLEQDLHLIAA